MSQEPNYQGRMTDKQGALIGQSSQAHLGQVQQRTRQKGTSIQHLDGLTVTPTSSTGVLELELLYVLQ